jgi:hypothetical protein
MRFKAIKLEKVSFQDLGNFTGKKMDSRKLGYGTAYGT